jgi:UDP-N-acetylglucosamine 2-epimerase (non-hydrolysing)
MSASGPAPFAVLLGTRPEAIKLAPVILALRRSGTPVLTVTTGQHSHLVPGILDLFDVRADLDLELMREGQTLDYILATAIERVGELLAERQPRAVIVQGDTTSMLGATLAAFHRRIPVAHVEGGLRSGDMAQPFPEEMNRRAASVIARWHFAPTSGAAANLAREGIVDGVHVCGNTVVDALQQIVSTGRARPPEELARFVSDRPYILATAHRRESWDGGIARIARALRDLVDARPGYRLIFATHPNPIARGPVEEMLGGHARARIVDALDYPAFLGLLRGATLAISDSGGVQEEGPTLGVPVLVTRATTERPEGVEAGAVQLVGTDPDRIRETSLGLIDDRSRLSAMRAAGRELYGDGHAAERIVEILAREAPAS